MSRTSLLPLLSGCRPDEGLLIGRLWLLAFCLGLTMVLFRTAAEALFLGRIGESGLPRAYLISAILSAVLVAGFFYLHSRATKLTTFTVLIGIFLISVALLRWSRWLGLGEEREEVIRVGRYVAGAVYLLGALGFWPIAACLLDLRQGKRLFGFLAAGEGLAEILGGLAIHLLVPILGVRVLFDAAMLAMVAALVIGRQLLKGHAANTPLPAVAIQDQPATPTGAEGSQRDKKAQSAIERVLTLDTLAGVTRSPYMLLILAGFGLATACWYLLDYTFLAGLTSMSSEPRQLAAWLGPFFAAAAGLSLLAQLLLAPRLLEQVGVRYSLPVLPLTLAIGVSTAIALGLSGFATAAFLAVVATKLIERVLTRGVQVPTMRVLYQTVPAPQRPGFQTTVEAAGIVVAGFASLVLMVFREYVAPGATFMLIALAFVLFTWAWASLVLGRMYLTHLQSRLVRPGRKARYAQLVADPAAREILIGWLRRQDPADVLIGLKFVAMLPTEPTLIAVIADLLAHPSAIVRREAALRLAATGDRQWADRVSPLVQRDPAPKVRSAALLAMAALGPAALESLVELADGPDESLARAALAGLLRHGGLAEIMAAGPRLMAWSCSSDPARRAAAAAVLGEVGRPAFYRTLLTLLNDPVASVRRAALAAAAEVQYADLWPAVCEQLERTDLRMAAVRTLLRADREALPAVIAAVDAPTGGTPRRRLLVRLAWRVGGPEAIPELLRWTNSADLRVRLEALDCLIRMEYLLSPSEQLAQLEQIEDDLRHTTENVAVAAELDEPDGLLGRALRVEWRRRAEVVLARLELLEPSSVVRNVRQRLREFRGERCLALEALELILPASGLGRALVGLLDDMPESQRLDRLTAWTTPADGKSVAARLRHLWLDGETLSWTRSCLLHQAGQNLMGELKDVVVLALKHADPVVQETAAWAAARVWKGESLDPDPGTRAAAQASRNVRRGG